MKVKYLGEKAPRTFSLPIPFMSMSERAGFVRFESAGDVQEIEPEHASAMCAAFPELFALVTEKAEKKPWKHAGADSPTPA